MLTQIHPTAIVDSDAVLGLGVKIGPFCTVGPHVVLEDGVELVSHVAVDGHTRLGEGVKIFHFSTIGLAPQDLKYKGEETETVIGARTQIREHASIHRGTVTGSGITRIGADCLLMATVHVAHDCVLGDGVIISNNVVLGGHVEQFDALETPVALEGQGIASIWAEDLITSSPDVTVDLRYGKTTGEWLDNHPAMITRKVGKGSISYLGTLPEPNIMARILTANATAAGVQPVFGALPEGVEACRRTGDVTTVYILINHGGKTAQVKLPHPMRNLLGTNASAISEVSLTPQAVAVVEP